MTAPLKWRSQLCPCGYCPDGTRIEWRHNLFDLLFNPDHGFDIHFKPRRRVSGKTSGKSVTEANPSREGTRDRITAPTSGDARPLTAANPSGHWVRDPNVGSSAAGVEYFVPDPPRARTRNGRKALEGS